MLDQVFAGFVDESPVSVMFRGTLENVFSSERLDAIFEKNAKRQISGELAFSTCAGLLSLVTTRIQPSVNAATSSMSKRSASQYSPFTTNSTASNGLFPKRWFAKRRRTSKPSSNP